MSEQCFIIERGNIKIGDAVSSLSLVQSCRRRHPDACIVYRVPEPTIRLFDYHPDIDFLNTDFGTFSPDDNYINLTNWCTASHYEMRMGSLIDRSREQIFTEACGIPWEKEKPRLYLHQSESIVTRSRMVSFNNRYGEKPTVLLVYRSDERWKDWPHAQEFCTLAKQKGFRVFVLNVNANDDLYGTEGHPARTEGDVKGSEGYIIHVGRQHLRRLMGLIAMVDTVVSIDSGPLHIADALNKPTVALFGSMSTVVREMKYDSNIYYLQGRCIYDILPCQYFTCEHGSKIQPCMTNLRAEEVFDAVEEVYHNAHDNLLR